MKISQTSINKAIQLFQSMSPEAKLSLADEVAREQPHLLGSIMVLPQMSVSMEKTEVALEGLLIIYLAIKQSGKGVPVITENDLARSMDCLVGEIQFIQELPEAFQGQSVLQSHAIKKEPTLAAFVIAHLGHDALSDDGPEHDKYMVMSLMNIVRSIAVCT